MLTTLYIKDFIIVKDLEVDFNPGLNIITGETGAGKSIILNAIGFLLGNKVDSKAIRQNTKKAVIQGAFLIKNHKTLIAQLTRLELTDDAVQEVCYLKRILQQDGRSKAFINDMPVSIGTLKTIGSLLVEVLGQHTQQQLFDQQYQRTLLDKYCQHDALLAVVNNDFNALKSIQQTIDDIYNNSEANQETLAIWQYYLDELLTFSLQPNEIDQLNKDHDRLAHTEELKQSIQHVLALLSEAKPSMNELAQQAIRLVEPLISHDEQLSGILEMLHSIAITNDECSKELSHYLGNINEQPAQLERIKQRLAQAHELARKHHVDVEKLTTFTQELQQKIDGVTHQAARLNTLKKNLQQAKTNYEKSAGQLSHSRKQHAERLIKKVTAFIQELGMQHGKLSITFNKKTATVYGIDDVDFLIAANPDQPFNPISKVASGGELSRLSLALYVAIVTSHFSKVMIFDEVDAGIGGKVAEMVGVQLKKLALSGQVICITHQPQIAALADHHFVVQKQFNHNKTNTTIKKLNQADRVNELARMLGGASINQQTIDHAKTLLNLTVK